MHPIGSVSPTITGFKMRERRINFIEMGYKYVPGGDTLISDPLD